MQTLTKDAVKTVAEELMKKNGTTTTLDVKKELRGKDYYATQNMVSTFMSELAGEENWAFNANGQFRTYELPGPLIGDDDDATSTSTTKDKWWVTPQVTPQTPPALGNQAPPKKKLTRTKCWNAQPKPDGTMVAGDWLAYDFYDPNMVIAYPGNVTRDAARWAFAKANGKKKDDVRAHRV